MLFGDTRCSTCSVPLGFRPDTLTLIALPDAGTGPFRRCANYSETGVCNWLAPRESADSLCIACRLNHTTPNLNEPGSKQLWVEVESSKRHLLYGLSWLGLDLRCRRDDPVHGLSFDIEPDAADDRVLTGQDDALINFKTIANDSKGRERSRAAFRERSGPLLGHFRHEVGHYYWSLLVADGGPVDAFRRVFGDERGDYAQALERHHDAPLEDYRLRYISRFASSHPCEDFAETFANYLNMRDTLETAQHFGFSRVGSRASGRAPLALTTLLDDWQALTLALNAINRSRAVPDAYPFAFAPLVEVKLAFVHELISSRARSHARA